MSALPFIFLEPSDEIMREIAGHLQELPTVSERALQNERAERALEHDTFKGDLLQVLLSFRSALDEDYKERIAEARDVVWAFEFVVDNYEMKFGDSSFLGLGVLTRLFAPDRGKGSIFYGRKAFRIGADQYLYWLE